MDVSRLKKVLAGVSVAAVSLSQMGSAIAAYSDVSAGVWYEEAVDAFTDAGYLDASQTKFRGGDQANRAEFVKLIVELNGGILSTPPAVPSFSDVATSAWYYGYMEEAAKEGWVRGDKDCYGTKPCNARPGANINRAEAAALIVRAFSLEATGDAPQFVDNPTGQWYTDAIQTAADSCVLQGDDSTGRVRPSDSMNRAEMVVMLHRVDQGLQYGVDCESGTPVEGAAISSAEAVDSDLVAVDFTVAVDQDSAEDAANYTVTSGTTTVEVSSVELTGDNSVELTLASDLDASKTYTVEVSGVWDMAQEEEINDTATFKGYSAVPMGDGVLEVSSSSKNPTGDAVPRGAIGVSMLSVDLTASCEDSVVIEDLTVLHEGFGATSDITGVYAVVDGARVSRKRTIDSKDQSATLHFSSPLTVAACKSVTLDLVADMSTTATVSAEHNLVVELPSDVVSNAKQVKGNFPLKGNTFRVAAVTAGTLSVSYLSVSPNEVKVGDKEVLLGKFEVSVNSVEDQTIYSMTLQQNGTAAEGDVTNLKIRRSDGTVLTNTVTEFDGDYATFVFNPPFIVKQGDRLTLSVVGDVSGGAGDTVRVQFEETADIFSVGSLYGYGVNGQLYGAQVSLASTTNTNGVTINAGQFTISIDGPAQQTYTRDQDDALLANIEFDTGTADDLDVRKIFLAVQGNSNTGAALNVTNGTSYDNIHEVLENVTLKNTKTGRSIDGVRLTGSSDFGSTTGVGTYQVYRFDDFTLKGNEDWQLLVDFIDNGNGNSPDNGDQFKVHICGEPQEVSTGTNTTGCTFGGLVNVAVTSDTAKSYQMQVEGLSTGDAVTDVRPRGVVTGTAQRIATANLTVAVKSIGSLDTAVKNTKNVNLFRFEARAGEAKDVLLTKASFASASGSLNNGQNYTLWADTDYNGTVDTIVEKGVTAVGSAITFSKMTGGGFVIPKEKTVAFEVHADISASLTNNWLQLAFETSSSSYIEAEDVVRGSSLSGIKTNGTCSVTTCDIVVTTVGSQPYKLVSQGDLYVTKDTVAVRAHQCLGGTLCDPVLRLQFHAENEAIDVTDLQLTSSGGTAGSVDRLELYKDGSTTAFATATVGGCGSDDVRNYYHTNGTTGTSTASTFCAKMQSQQLVIAKGADVKVLVRPRMKTDVDGATPNDTLQFFLDPMAVSNNATGSGAVRARGKDSSNNLTANSGDSAAGGEVFIGIGSAAASNALVKGEKSTSVLSKITSITNANPDANGTQVPTGVADIGQFKVAAAANSNSKNGLNKVVLSGVMFNVTATNVIIDPATFYFYNKANSTVTKTCTATTTAGVTIGFAASGSFLVNCPQLQNSGVNTTIDQGTDATFVLRATVSNPQVSSSATSTLQVSLQNFDSPTRNAYSASSSHFEWVDKDNAAATTATFLWVEYPETTIKSTSYQS